MLANVLLGIVSMCTLVSFLPQAIKLIKTKESDDISISSWVLWVISSLSYVLYAYLCTDEFMLRFENTLEFSFCLLILFLTILYRRK